MGINAKQFREVVVRPTLEYLAPLIPYSQEAEDLLMMTAAHESQLGTFLKQVNGPALGVYQMEPATYDDIYINFLSHRGVLREVCEDLVSVASVDLWEENDGYEPLVMNLAYATAMARVHYYRVPAPLPRRIDYDSDRDYHWALALYAKQHYNTPLGKATAEKYYDDYTRLCL